MCDKKEFEALKKAVGDVKHDTGNIRNSVNGIFERVKEINGRVGETEKKIEHLEDPRIKIAECIQKDTITQIKENMLTINRFEAYLQDLKKQQQREEDIAIQREAIVINADALNVAKVEKSNRRTQIFISVGTVIIAAMHLLAILV